MNISDIDFSPLFPTSDTKNSNRGFEARFGEAVVHFGIAGVPNLLILNFKRLGLNHSEFYFLCVILSKRHATEAPFFSINKLSKVYGMSQDTLHRAKNGLIKKGYLAIYEKQENGRGNGRNYYEVNGLLITLKNLAIEKIEEENS